LRELTRAIADALPELSRDESEILAALLLDESFANAFPLRADRVTRILVALERRTQ
jgi:hypothetical protein